MDKRFSEKGVGTSTLPLILRRTVLYTEPIKLRNQLALSPVGLLQGRAIGALASRHAALVASIFPQVTDILDFALHAADLSRSLSGSPNILLDIALASTNRDHDRELIQLLLVYYSSADAAPASPVSLYGTTAFQLVWEDMCRFVVGVDDSQLSMSNPVYNIVGGVRRPTEPQRPDLVFRTETHAYILDAKYYPNFPKTIPQLEDVRKQFYYGLSSSEAITPRLAFLFPGTTDQVLIYIGRVDMEGATGLDSRFQSVHCFALDWKYTAKAYTSRLVTVNLRETIVKKISEAESHASIRPPDDERATTAC